MIQLTDTIVEMWRNSNMEYCPNEQCLYDNLKKGVVFFQYIKKDGTHRKAIGTMSQSIIDLYEKFSGKGVKGNSTATTVIPYFDLCRLSMRCVKIENVEAVFATDLGAATWAIGKDLFASELDNCDNDKEREKLLEELKQFEAFEYFQFEDEIKRREDPNALNIRHKYGLHYFDNEMAERMKGMIADAEKEIMKQKLIIEACEKQLKALEKQGE